MIPNIIHISRSYFHLNVYIAWTSLQTRLWKELKKQWYFLVCAPGLFQTTPNYWTPAFLPHQYFLSQHMGPAARDAGLFSRGKRWFTVHMFACKLGTVEPQNCYMYCYATTSERERQELPATHVGTHRAWNKYLHSGNEITETRKMPVRRHLKHRKIGPEGVSV